MSTLPYKPPYFVSRLLDLHARLREEVLGRLNSGVPPYTRRGVRAGDMMYAIDEVAERVLVEFCEDWGREAPFALVAEGVEGGRRIFPEGALAAEAQFVLIVDPIDGTRGLMYDKRSAWILSGVAPDRGAATNLRDIEVAVQTEIPTTRQHLAAVLYATQGGGAWGEMHNVLSGEMTRFAVEPSAAETLAHGFATIAKFFPGGKVLAAEIEERLMEAVLGPPADGIPLVFDDQYIASGGQLYELAVGHDLFTADLRPVVHELLPADRKGRPLCAHPYDLCTELIAREAGVIVCDRGGGPLSAPLDTETGMAWMGFANRAIYEQVYPVLRGILEEMGWRASG